MIRLGILDFDTSHVVEFTRRLNQVEGTPAEQWVEGARVVVGCPGQSALMPERIAGFTQQMKKYGVKLVDKPEDMIRLVDGMLITSVDGTVHYERARPFLEAGIPCFIDKPFTCSVADARRIIALSTARKVPVFSSSALRYAPEVVAFQKNKEQWGTTVGVITWGPASQSPKPQRNAGLFHYGIHAIEMLYTLMGPGCQQVVNVYEQGAETVTGRWKDGRIATVRGLRRGATPFGLTVFAEKVVQTTAVGTQFIYRELLKKIVEFFQQGRSPVPLDETLEIIAFIEAANASGSHHGQPVSLSL
ncbi:MAG: Gfo/Idh/MocA family oxidoreductase [Gemmataceae bacterium]|nr:Gfo/Idh/MocA family oxidoreductase [Gemmataceae bacterium]MCS7270825.1 Gfo/Idh/MocA family oxidoreductase [Gemmataceae bacterium]MDW8243768.1 Gfo/Idh/MocA family oxidoreductase [Thermogemmata sp.]